VSELEGSFREHVGHKEKGWYVYSTHKHCPLFLYLLCFTNTMNW
jgi:hypothetical protein